MRVACGDCLGALTPGHAEVGEELEQDAVAGGDLGTDAAETVVRDGIAQVGGGAASVGHHDDSVASVDGGHDAVEEADVRQQPCDDEVTRRNGRLPGGCGR